MAKSISARHGVVCRLPGERFGYFGWPSVARLSDGRLAAVASGLRYSHVCPWGKTTLYLSDDEGETWCGPHIVNDSPLDDRDAGIIELAPGEWMVNWFTTDTRIYLDDLLKQENYKNDPLTAEWMRALLAAHTEETVTAHQGSWTRVTHDGGKTWDAPVRCPVSAPHGGILLKDGRILYLGKRFPDTMKHYDNFPIAAAESTDGGRSWHELGLVPEIPGVPVTELHEPHLCEMPSGRIVGVIRGHKPYFCVYQTDSEDGGRTWSVPRLLDAAGSPPHLMLHSSGALVCVYGHREAPFGQRAIVSRDEGRTWSDEIVLRDDGFSGDLGYPCSCELPSGEIFTLYYQQKNRDEKTGILWTKWTLPAEA